MTVTTLTDSRVYVNVYFRINTATYGINGFSDEIEREQFYSDISDILTGLGFDVKPPKFSGACPEGFQGVEKLYCHPQSLSGYVAEESIDIIENALLNGTTFKHYRTDRYETVYNYTPDEFKLALDEQRTNIEEQILTVFKTKRRNLFLPIRALDRVSSNLQYFKTGVVGASPMARLQGEYINQVFEDMIQQGKIIKGTKNDVSYYRTRSPRDPK